MSNPNLYRLAMEGRAGWMTVDETVKLLSRHLLDQDSRLSVLEQREPLQAQPAFTDEDTKAANLAADSLLLTPSLATGYITRPTSQLPRLLGAMSEAERTHVEQCSACRGLLERLSSSLSMHVPGAAPTTSTSANQVFDSSAAASALGDVSLPSSPSPDRFAGAGKAIPSPDAGGTEGECLHWWTILNLPPFNEGATKSSQALEVWCSKCHITRSCGSVYVPAPTEEPLCALCFVAKAAHTDAGWALHNPSPTEEPVMQLHDFNPPHGDTQEMDTGASGVTGSAARTTSPASPPTPEGTGERWRVRDLGMGEWAIDEFWGSNGSRRMVADGMSKADAELILVALEAQSPRQCEHNWALVADVGSPVPVLRCLLCPAWLIGGNVLIPEPRQEEAK